MATEQDKFDDAIWVKTHLRVNFCNWMFSLSRSFSTCIQWYKIHKHTVILIKLKIVTQNIVSNLLRIMF